MEAHSLAARIQFIYKCIQTGLTKNSDNNLIYCLIKSVSTLNTFKSEVYFASCCGERFIKDLVFIVITRTSVSELSCVYVYYPFYFEFPK